MAEADGVDGLTAWARTHGLTVEAGAHLPRTTPLLAEGEVHSIDALAGGWLSKYVEAKIALVSRGDDEHFTVAVTHVPKAKRFALLAPCIVFLIEQAPKGFAFEYVEGTLCVSLHGNDTLGEDLDRLREATVELVRRIRAEIAERLGPAAAARSAPGEDGFEGAADSTPQS
ncbi:MAG: hypothetical protein JWO14_3643 [Solirubrobacterales bacterium]|nr:hypothetical protein [Solirubrobacterales bacterium]